MKKVLFIGMVWPEPTSTAAGGRMKSLLELFISEGFSVHFACAAAVSERSEDLEALGCPTHEITLNSESFNEFLTGSSPDLVVFDRFITEEQYGWRVADVCPDACRILDTEDLHFLRAAREKSIKKHGDLSEVDLYSDMAKRELASILRCDLSLIISEAEMELLVSTFNIPKGLLVYNPISFPEITSSEMELMPDYDSRSGFMTIGNFKHAPNLDAVKFTKKHVWPEIKKLMPDAEMHVYGAYLDENNLSWNTPENDFYLHGAVPDANEVFQKARVCLAPIRYGAGLKGKLLMAAVNGTPSVTSSIGAEGIESSSKWSGAVAETPKEIAKCAVELYQNKDAWKEAQEKGVNLINHRFQKPAHDSVLMSAVLLKMSNLESERKKHFIGSILQFHSLRSTEFMSRWIAEKNKSKKG